MAAGWRPDVDPAEPTTLVVFELEEVPEGTRLTVMESGSTGFRSRDGARHIARTIRGGPARSKPQEISCARAARAETPAPVFAALGDENRLRLLARLGSGEPMSISRLTVGSGISRQGITKHLRVLAGAGLVHSSRRGKESLWRLERRRLEEARRSLDLISRQWDESLGKLKLFVEEKP